MVSIKLMLWGIVFIIGGYLLITKYIPNYLWNMSFENPLGTLLGANFLIYGSYGLMIIGGICLIRGFLG